MTKKYKIMSDLIDQRKCLMTGVRFIDREMWEILKKFRTKLKPKDYQILKARLYEKKTLEEIGKRIGVSKERIKQIEFRELMKLDNIIDKNNKINYVNQRTN